MRVADPAAWRDAREILAVRLDSIGDVLMTTPAMRAIRDSARRARLTLLTSPAGAAVARHVPEIDDVIVYEPPWMKHSKRHDAVEDLAAIAEVRSRGFDAAVVFTVHTQSALPAALFLYLAGVPLRLAHARENPYDLLTDWVPEPELDEPTRHEVRRQLDLVAALGYTTDEEHLSFRVPDVAMRLVRDEVLPAAGIALGRPWVVMSPGATAPSRRWRPSGFAEVATRLAVEDGWPIVLTGSSDEIDLVETVRAQTEAPVVSLAGQLDLAELAALLAVAPLLVSSNSGPVHLAAAVATPVVDVYALTNLQHTPWQVPNRVLSHDVPCRGCRRSICPLGHHACLELVTPDQVVAAARELMAETTGETPSAGERASLEAVSA
ncbi:MAG: lipopolysaccharide heptosyltransferase II [Chloroflexota bacterium]